MQRSRRTASAKRSSTTRQSRKVSKSSSVSSMSSLAMASHAPSMSQRVHSTHTSSSSVRSIASSSQQKSSPSSTASRRSVSTSISTGNNSPVSDLFMKQRAPSSSFRSTQVSRNYINPPNTIRPEAILNTPIPITPPSQMRTHYLPHPVEDGQQIITGAVNAPVRVTVGIEQFDPAEVDNKFDLQPKHSSKAFNEDQLEARKLFLNAFPRTPASPAGKILQTAYSNYPIYNQPIDWRNRLKFVPFQITVKETPDYTPYLDTRWYAEAMPRMKARVDINLRNFFFLTGLERQILGELLGPRYNWHTGKIALSCGNLRNNHANTNRCFQWLHEATHRAVELAPIIAESQQKHDAAFIQSVKERSEMQRKINAELAPFTSHKPRPKATGSWLGGASVAAQGIDEADQQFM